MTEVTFDELFAEVTAAGEGFGHRQHVHLSWLALRSSPDPESLVSQGIQGVAERAGVPGKYHVTMTRAWLQLVGFHAAEHPVDDFEVFAEQNPALLDKRLLDRFYEQDTLSGEQARTGWVAPDRCAFPWS